MNALSGNGVASRFALLVMIAGFACKIQAHTGTQVEIVRKRSRVQPLTAEWVEPMEYVANVTSSLTRKLREYGVCNLPVRNKVYNFNAERFNKHLPGSLTYEGGLVVRIGNITRRVGKVMKFREKDEASVKFRLCFENLTIVFDLRGDPDVSSMAVLNFPTSYIEVVIAYNLAAKKAGVKSMKTISVSNPKTAYIPDSDIMTSVAYTAHQSMAASLFGDVTSWIENILQPMVDNIVRESPFPMKLTRAKRRPTTRAQCCQRNRDHLTGNPLPLQGLELRERELCCKKHRAKISLKSGMETQKKYAAKLTSKWDEPMNYLDDITLLFSQRLKEYGVENLPVPDKFYNVNNTRYNVDLLGSTKYVNGLVIDIHNISRFYRHHFWYIKDDTAVIHYQILMRGVEIIYDLNVDLKVTNIVGTAQLNFPENLIEVYLFCNLHTREVGLTSMKIRGVQGPLTNFGPDSQVMRAIAYNARLSMATSLFSDLPVWIETTLQGILESVVQELPFPIQFTQEHS